MSRLDLRGSVLFAGGTTVMGGQPGGASAGPVAGSTHLLALSLSQIRVFLLDDHEGVRRGVRALLGNVHDSSYADVMLSCPVCLNDL